MDSKLILSAPEQTDPRCPRPVETKSTVWAGHNSLRRGVVRVPLENLCPGVSLEEQS